MEKTSGHVDAYFKFLQECEAESGALSTRQAWNLRKLCTAVSGVPV